MACKNRDDRIMVLMLLAFLLLAGTPQCEGRGLRQSKKKNPLLNALYKLNFIRTVEPMQLPPSPPPANSSLAGDAASLATGDVSGSGSPYCVNPPNAPSGGNGGGGSTSTPPFTSTPFTPFPPIDQPPPLPPLGSSSPPPFFEPSPPSDGGGGTSPFLSPPAGGFTPITPGSPPSPIFVVPSPPSFTPGGGGGAGGGGYGGGGGGNGGEGGGGGGGGGGGNGGGEGGGGNGGGGGGGGGIGGGGNGGFLPPIVYPPPLAPPAAPGETAVWCVAKPTVPDPIMQEAMDYACGSGAECGSIQPSGACYEPDTVLAHASYAFNSYWQMTKAAGGTCDFGGTATIVTRDPSEVGLFAP
uniref:X8 domain-containing protein n=1 Tax=Leersia perrieri TaxID=77586 RepID=A0A0D9W9C3_9ORYZ